MFAAFDDSEDDESDSGGTAPDADPPAHLPPDPQDLQQPVAPINRGRAQLDMRKVMFTAGPVEGLITTECCKKQMSRYFKLFEFDSQNYTSLNLPAIPDDEPNIHCLTTPEH